MKSGENIIFDAKKNFTYVKPLGQGGTGDAHLFKDETTNMQFAVKKYVPKDPRYIDEQYARFVDEIKMLFLLSHPNIVRVYNYYLFPSAKTGYLQMEFIDGVSIDQHEPDPWGKDWNDIFSETVSAFEYLERMNILHRDIRPANIMIDKNDSVKIIDFGFGKQVNPTNMDNNSIILNWPATEMPNEVQLNQEYNHKTEVFFVGMLFKHILKENEGFRYYHVIAKMVQINPDQRYESFADVLKDISAGVLSELSFNEEQKTIYQEFASFLVSQISNYIDKYNPVDNVSEIILRLARVIRNSALEEYLQDNSKLIGCFINGGYSYSTSIEIPVHVIVGFYELLTKMNAQKQKIIYDNIYTRLAKIKIHMDEDDNLPF